MDDGTGLDGIPPGTLTLRVSRDFGRAWAWVRGAAYGDLDPPGPSRAVLAPGITGVVSLGFRF